MQRYEIKIELSFFAESQEDAEYLARHFVAHTNALGGQMIARIAPQARTTRTEDGVSIYHSPTCYCGDADCPNTRPPCDGSAAWCNCPRCVAEFEREQAAEIAAENAWQLR